MENSNRVFVPMVNGTILSSSKCTGTKVDLDKMKDVSYASAVRSIMYAMKFTRHDLAYAMIMTRKFR